MSNTLSEEEQVEAIKKWIKNNASAIITGLCAALLIIGGHNFWQRHSAQKAESATAEFAVVIEQQLQEDVSDGSIQRAEDLLTAYPKSVYAVFTSMALAGNAARVGNLEDAEKRMEWAHANVRDKVLKPLVALRLARVKYGLEKYDQAEAILDVANAGVYAALYYELLGDISLAKKDVVKAKSFLRRALEAMDPESQVAAIVRIKLGNLGEDV